MQALAESKVVRKITFEKMLQQTNKEKEAEKKLIESLSNYSSSNFASNSWYIDKELDKAHFRSINFKKFFSEKKLKYKLAKLFLIIQLNRSAGIETINYLHRYFYFLDEKNINLLQVSKKTFGNFSFWLDQQKKKNDDFLTESYKHKLFHSALIFHTLMNGHSTISYIDGVVAIPNPYNRRSQNTKYKVIDVDVLEKLDEHFSLDTTLLHFKVAYWILRLFATRPEDTLNYPLDCVKLLADNIATIKHAIVKNSKNARGIDYNIEFLNLKEPMQKMLFNLIEAQQKITSDLQVHTKKKNFLFTSKKSENSTYIPTTETLSNYLKKVQEKLSIPESKRAVPRDFKKTGLTQRAEAGWTAAQLKHIANHRTFGSIDAYSAPSESFMYQAQKEVLEADNKISHSYIFKGKVINEINNFTFETKFYENPRAHQIPNLGFCPDPLGCGNHFECLDCESLLPDKDLEEYYLDQVDRYVKISEKQLELGDKITAKDSYHRATLFASLYNKVQQQNGEENND